MTISEMIKVMADAMNTATSPSEVRDKNPKFIFSFAGCHLKPFFKSELFVFTP
jgi:hypothetical protein